MRECVASLGAAAVARPRRADKPRPSPTFPLHGVIAPVTTNDGHASPPCASGFSAFSDRPRRPRSCFSRKQRRSSCRGRHCVSGDLTRSFLPRRGVFTFVFVEDALIFRHQSRTTRSRRHLLMYHSLAKSPSRKPRN